jgi:hypothetical protein
MLHVRDPGKQVNGVKTPTVIKPHVCDRRRVIDHEPEGLGGFTAKGTVHQCAPLVVA